MEDSQRLVPPEPGKAGWFERIQRSRLGLGAAALAVFLTAIAGVTDSINTIGVWLHLRPDALDVSEGREKENFSREIIRSIWEQLYWSRKVLDLQTQLPPVDPAERDRAWERYQSIVDQWHRDLMVNILSLQQYYGSARRTIFEREIQPKFREIDACLAALSGRRATGRWKCAADHTTPAALNGFIDRFSNRLYCFASGLPDAMDAGGCPERPMEVSPPAADAVCLSTTWSWMAGLS